VPLLLELTSDVKWGVMVHFFVATDCFAMMEFVKDQSHCMSDAQMTKNVVQIIDATLLKMKIDLYAKQKLLLLNFARKQKIVTAIYIVTVKRKLVNR
jgi:hypothetical protein